MLLQIFDIFVRAKIIFVDKFAVVLLTDCVIHLHIPPNNQFVYMFHLSIIYEFTSNLPHSTVPIYDEFAIILQTALFFTVQQINKLFHLSI